jgi:hypothetical protein
MALFIKNQEKSLNQFLHVFFFRATPLLLMHPLYNIYLYSIYFSATSPLGLCKFLTPPLYNKSNFLAFASNFVSLLCLKVSAFDLVL